MLTAKLQSSKLPISEVLPEEALRRSSVLPQLSSDFNDVMRVWHCNVLADPHPHSEVVQKGPNVILNGALPAGRQGSGVEP